MFGIFALLSFGSCQFNYWNLQSTLWTGEPLWLWPKDIIKEILIRKTPAHSLKHDNLCIWIYGCSDTIFLAILFWLLLSITADREGSYKCNCNVIPKFGIAILAPEKSSLLLMLIDRKQIILMDCYFLLNLGSVLDIIFLSNLKQTTKLKLQFCITSVH